MATIFGFKKIPLPSGSKAVTNAMKMAENYIKTHTDEYGEVSDASIYYNAASLLSNYSDDLTASNKIADYQNKAKQLLDKISEAENSKVAFNYDFQKAITDTIQQNYKDPRGLFFKLAETYGTALEDFDEKILGDVLTKNPKGQKIPAEVLSYRDGLSKKVMSLTNLANSYLSIDPATETAGPLNPNTYGVFIQTNPQTGAIVSMDVDAVDSLDKPKTGYSKTNSRYGRIPIYLNYYTEENKRMANLGGVKYEGGKEEIQIGDTSINVDILKRTGQGLGITAFLERTFRRIGKETGAGVKEEQQEFPLAATPFDYYQIPTDSVVKDYRNNYYFYDNKGVLWKAKDQEYLKKYLKETGKNPSDADSKAFYAHPDFISAKFIPNKEGKQNLIDDNFFKGVISSSGELITPTKTNIFRLPEQGELQMIDFSTLSPITRATPTRTPAIKPETPKYTARGYETKKVIEQGREIFKT